MCLEYITSTAQAVCTLLHSDILQVYLLQLHVIVESLLEVLGTQADVVAWLVCRMKSDDSTGCMAESIWQHVHGRYCMHGW